MKDKICLIGLFEHSQDVKDKISFDTSNYTLEKNILFYDYDFAKTNEVQLFVKGLIYNSDELKKELKLSSKNNAELLLEIFLKYEIEGFKKLNGQFSILIKKADETIIVRDRHGEGPTVFYSDDFYADSISGVLSFNDFSVKPNFTSLDTFLRISYIPSPLTAFDGLKKLAPGNVLRKNANSFNVFSLFDYDDFISNEVLKIDEKEAIEEYERLLQLSIKRRIGNADTVGALLSGGYDSGGNIAVLREIFSGEIKSYSIGFKDNALSEHPYAEMMANAFNAKHSLYLMDGSEIEYLPEIIASLGDPFSESGFMLNYSAMKFVADEKLPVVIGGDGNDQLFGTAAKELALNYLSSKYGAKVFQKIFSGISGNKYFDNDNLQFRLRFHNEKILNIMKPDNFGFNSHLMKDIFDLDKNTEHPYFKTIPKKYVGFKEFFDQHNYYQDIRQNINEVILFKASKLASLFDVNLAFTYIDTEIYNFLKKLPLHLKVKGKVKDYAKGRGISKFLLKSVAKPKLPKEVTERKKQGGFSPLAIFFDDKNRSNQIFNYLQNSDFVKQNADKEKLNLFINKYKSLGSNSSYWFWYKQVKANQLFNLLETALWWDIFINNKKGKLSEF